MYRHHHHHHHHEIIKEIKTEKLNVTRSNIHVEQYRTRLHRMTIEDCESDTLMRFLFKLSSKPNHTPQAYLIGNIVTNALINYPTPLQIAFGVLMRNSKGLVSNMSESGVSCSYDELLRFQKSAAVAAATSPALQGISDSDSGLIPVLIDTFNADISLQNGNLSTHSLGLIVTQPSSSYQYEYPDNKETIKRVIYNDMTKIIDYSINVDYYNSPLNPKMPTHAANKAVMSLKILAEKVMVSTRAWEMDFLFLKEMSNNDNCPEFNGCNTQICRDQGHSPKFKTKPMYLPFINMMSSNPDTIMAALHQTKQSNI